MKGTGGARVSAIPLEDAIERAAAPSAAASSRPRRLPYFLLVAAGAVAVTAPFLAEFDGHTGDWLEFVLLATSVAVAQFFVVRTPGNKSYHTTGVFLIAAALLLPPALLALIPLIQHMPEWLRSRGTWYVQIDEHLRVHDRDDVGVGGGAPHPGRGRADRVRRRPLRARRHRGGDRPRRAQLGADRAHDPPASTVIRCASSSRTRRSRRSSSSRPSASSSPRSGPATRGSSRSRSRRCSLIHRALSVPQLQAEARVDPKTGLFNARYFASALVGGARRARSASSGRCR